MMPLRFLLLFLFSFLLLLLLLLAFFCFRRLSQLSLLPSVGRGMSTGSKDRMAHSVRG